MKKVINQSTKILILNGVSVLALLFTVFSLYCYNDVSNKAQKASEERFELTYNANRFMNGSASLTNEVRAYAATGDQEHYDDYWNEINNLKNRDLGVAAMKEIGITDEEQAMINEMSELSNTLVPLEEEAMENVAAGKREQALSYVYGPEYSSSVEKINQLKSSFLEKLDSRALGEVNRLAGVLEFIHFWVVVSIILVAGLEIYTYLYTKGKIIKPVLHIRDEMEQISKGNLSADFTLESDTSEIGRLIHSIHTTKRELKKYISEIDNKLSRMADGDMNLEIDRNFRGEFLPIQDALRTILDAFNRALSEIRQVSGQVSDGAVQLASDSQMLSRGTVEQSSSVDELSQTMKGLSQQLERMAENAVGAKNRSMEASQQLDLSNQKMERLSHAMEDISSASDQIGGIIKTIEDIAFQTNILALNAAVEAARAGNAGKGFAVVADEVRNLAAKSSEAAQNTTSLIENMLNLIQMGTDLAFDTTGSLASVVTGAEQATGLMEEIASVSQVQTQALKEVMAELDQITAVVQNNSDASQRSASASEELNNQADALMASVNRFRLRD